MHATLVTFFEIPFEKKRRRQATYRLLSINRNIQYIPLVMDPHYIADERHIYENTGRRGICVEGEGYLVA